VQGLDYAYTLQGWIKGMNSETLDSTRDMGFDGKPGNANENFASDAFGYTLNYYNGDYSAIDNNRNNFIAGKNNMSNLATDAPGLYNGNINYMVTTITNPTSLQKMAQLTAYRYDQLNRLLQMRAYDTLNLATNTWNNPGTYNGMYANKFEYSANGNILTATANNKAGVAIDNQDYRYQTIDGKKVNNRLYAINDSATTTSGNDLLDQLAYDNTASTINTANNYAYTPIGELKSNKQDSIADIQWTVYGKIKSVARTTGCSKRNLSFDYDPTGNRIAKHVYKSDSTWLFSEYYVRDAQGNIMSTYKYTVDTLLEEASYKQSELHIYGSTALGIDKTETELIGAVQDTDTYTHTLGKKEYTGSNHLGNVLAVFTDKKIAHDSNSDGTVDYFTADIVAANDYAPFGGLLTERTFNKGSFPNSFNGKRDDAELGDWQDYGMRMYSPWTRRFPTVDPITKKYPELTPFQFASNTPIQAIDLDGLEAHFTNNGKFDRWGKIKGANAPVIIIEKSGDIDGTTLKNNVLS